jgi:hypothetical protein
MMIRSRPLLKTRAASLALLEEQKMAEYKGEKYEFPDEKEAKGDAVEAASDDFEIEIEDDTPPEDRGRAPMAQPVDEVTDEELATYDEKVQKRIKKFTRGYHDERRAKEEAIREREAAEAFAKQVYEENKRLQEQLANGSQAYIEQSKTVAEATLSAAEERYRKAYESADADAMITAQKEIAKATYQMEQAQPVQVEEPKVTPPPPAQTQAEPRLTPRTKDWLAENSDWFGKDEEMTSAAMGLDRKLQREYGPDYIGTEDYFRTIDRTMRKRFPEHFGSQDEDEAPSKTASRPVEVDTTRRAKQTTVVAPATRSTPPNRIKLKGSEANIAKRLGVPLEEYAKQAAKLNRG